MANKVITGIQHVALNVDDLAKAVDFYEALGLQTAARPEVFGSNGAWLVAGTVQIHLTVSDDFETPSASQHVAFETADIDAAIELLRGKGIECSEPFDLGAGRQSFLHDPAGNLLELNQPNQ